MNLYHIERTDQGGYDTFSDAVVVAANADDARFINPGGDYRWGPLPDWAKDNVDAEVFGWISENGFTNSYNWVNPEDVKVTLIGEADPGLKPSTVICASYHAG